MKTLQIQNEQIIKKATMVFYSNYYFREEKRLVLDTISEIKAIKEVKNYESNRRCVIIRCVTYKNVKVSELNYDMDFALSI